MLFSKQTQFSPPEGECECHRAHGPSDVEGALGPWNDSADAFNTQLVNFLVHCVQPMAKDKFEVSFGEVLKRAQSVQLAIPAMQFVRGKLLDSASLLLAMAGAEVIGDVELRAELRAVRMQKQGYVKSLLDLARCQCDITQTMPQVIDNEEYPWPNMSADLLSDFAQVVIDKDSIVTNVIEIHLLARVQKALNNVHREAVGSHLKAVSPDQFGNIAQVGSMLTRLIANGMSDKFVEQIAQDIAASSEDVPLELEKQFVQTVVELLKFTPPREWFVGVSEGGGCRYTHSEAGFIIDVCARNKVVVGQLAAHSLNRNLQLYTSTTQLAAHS